MLHELKIKSALFFDFINSSKFYILTIAIIAIAFIASFPWPPQRTHDLAAFMLSAGCLDCGLGHVSNELITTPFYHILKYLILSPQAYALASFLSFIICSIIFIRLVTFSGSAFQRKHLNILALSFVVMVGVIQILGFPFVDGLREFGLGVDFLHPSLTSRSILSLGFLFCSFYILKGRYLSASIAIAIGSMAHPSNGIVLTFIVMLMPLFITYAMNEKLSRNKLIGFYFFCFLGVVPIILKLVSLPTILSAFPSSSVTTSGYISNLYRDEIDDFSALFQILVYPKLFIMKVAFCITPIILLLVHRDNIINYHRLLRLVPLIALPFLFFFATATVELIYSKYGIFEFFMEKIINSQIGCRVVKYAGLPAIFIWFALCLHYINLFFIKFAVNQPERKESNFIQTIFYLSITIFILTFMQISEFQNIKNYTNLISSKNLTSSFMDQGRGVYYDALLDSGYSYNSVNNHYLFDCQTGSIYKKLPNASNSEKSNLYFGLSKNKLQDLTDTQFKTSFDNLKNRQEIVNLIELSVPSGAGIITPPYFNCFREFLPNYNIYFQEHDDGNFMLGSKLIYSRFIKRMENLNITYLNIPTQSSGLNIDVMRRNWFKLEAKNYLNIKNEQRNFEYLLTENSHNLDLKIIAKNETWTIYKIKYLAK
jgi:hypothetical protein